jgi:hypothetical protein
METGNLLIIFITVLVLGGSARYISASDDLLRNRQAPALLTTGQET